MAKQLQLYLLERRDLEELLFSPRTESTNSVIKSMENIPRVFVLYIKVTYHTKKSDGVDSL